MFSYTLPFISSQRYDFSLLPAAHIVKNLNGALMQHPVMKGRSCVADRVCVCTANTPVLNVWPKARDELLMSTSVACCTCAPLIVDLRLAAV